MVFCVTTSVVETLKQQIVKDWVDLSDANQKGNQASSRTTTTGTNHPTLTAAVVDDITNNKEVTKQVCTLDNTKLSFDPVTIHLSVLLFDRTLHLAPSVLNKETQVFFLGQTVWRAKVWKHGFVQNVVVLNLVEDFIEHFHLRVVDQHRGCFGPILEIEVVALKELLIVNLLTLVEQLLDLRKRLLHARTQQNPVKNRVSLFRIVGV